MRKLFLFFFFLFPVLQAQETTDLPTQENTELQEERIYKVREVLHSDDPYEIGINFNDSMLFEGLHAPTLFLRYSRRFKKYQDSGYAYRLALNYNSQSFVRRIDTNDSGRESFLLVQPGFEFQIHNRYSVWYVGTDLHFSQTFFDSDEADDNNLFSKTERRLDQLYGVQPFVGLKYYCTKNLAVSLEIAYLARKNRVKIDKKQSFNGTLNDEEHTDVTTDIAELKLSGIYLSFHF